MLDHRVDVCTRNDTERLVVEAGVSCLIAPRETSAPSAGASALFLCRSVPGRHPSVAWLTRGDARSCDWLGRFGRLLRLLSITAKEHHAAGQNEQEGHHQEGKDLRIGHTNS
jgi:hypothetical protein